MLELSWWKVIEERGFLCEFVEVCKMVINFLLYAPLFLVNLLNLFANFSDFCAFLSRIIYIQHISIIIIITTTTKIIAEIN